MMHQPHTTQTGFTLVETLVAITILLIIITGPMTVSMSTAKSTTYASEQVMAFFLAQEGAELAQKARDELLLEGYAGTEPYPWDEFYKSTTGALFEDCYTATGCGLEINSDTGGTVEVVDCTATNKCLLYYNSNETTPVRSRYTYDVVTDGVNNEKTPYHRKVTFTQISAEDVLVTSTVTWRTGNLKSDQVVTVETHLFNIYDN